MIRNDYVPLLNHGGFASEITYGFILDTVPDNILKELDDGYKNILDETVVTKKMNNQLAGEIEREYEFDFSDQFKKYVFDLAHFFESKSKGYLKNKIFNSIGVEMVQKAEKKLVYELPELKLKKGWVNLQKKHEYNPVHSHSGLLSFVVWHRVPYLIKDEKKASPAKLKDFSTSGMFQFLYPNGPHIEIYNLPIDKKYEGVISLFPADLCHTVLPFFSSDNYRVSFSGNIALKGESLMKFLNI